MKEMGWLFSCLNKKSIKFNCYTILVYPPNSTSKKIYFPNKTPLGTVDLDDNYLPVSPGLPLFCKTLRHCGTIPIM